MALSRMLRFAAIRGSDGAMGWREINMNRRKPPLRLAVIATAPGEDRRAAVLRKAAAPALENLRTQLPLDPDEDATKGFLPFLDGYLFGYVQQVALKHGVNLDDVTRALAVGLERQIVSLSSIGTARSNLAGARHDAGSFTGRLEALCGTRHPAGEAVRCWRRSDAALAFLTSCDNAAISADRVREGTHQG